MNLSQWSLQQEITLKMPVSCLSWNPSFSRLHPPMLAVGSDDTNVASGGKVFLFEYSESSHRWSKAETISTIVDPVHDIAFAPNLGRSYHILGIASKDVRIVILRPPQYVTTLNLMKSKHKISHFAYQGKMLLPHARRLSWKYCKQPSLTTITPRYGESPGISLGLF